MDTIFSVSDRTISPQGLLLPVWSFRSCFIYIVSYRRDILIKDFWPRSETYYWVSAGMESDLMLAFTKMLTKYGSGTMTQQMLPTEFGKPYFTRGHWMGFRSNPIILNYCYDTNEGLTGRTLLLELNWCDQLKNRLSKNLCLTESLSWMLIKPCKLEIQRRN